MNSLSIIFIIVYVSTIIFTLLIPKKGLNDFLKRRVDGDLDAKSNKYNSRYGYYKFLVFWSGVVGAVITFFIKVIFY